MSNILVTGGAGYVGSVCSEELLRQGHEVSVVDNLSTGHRDAVPSNAGFYELDIGDLAGMKRVLASKRFDAVFHFAAKALIPESITDPAAFYQANVIAAANMMQALTETGVRKFVFSSTAAVYGDPIETPIGEDHPKNPVNAYGETKLAFERLLQWYSRAYGFSVCAFRYFNASGGTDEHGERHDPETHLIPLLFEAAEGRREHFTIYGSDYPTPDGSCLRDFVHVLDIAQAHILALKTLNSPSFSAFNIGVGKSYSVREVHSLAEKLIGRTIPVREGSRRPGDPAILCASPNRLMSELGWRPIHSDLANIIKSAWSWAKKPHLDVSSGRNA